MQLKGINKKLKFEILFTGVCFLFREPLCCQDKSLRVSLNKNTKYYKNTVSFKSIHTPSTFTHFTTLKLQVLVCLIGI